MGLFAFMNHGAPDERDATPDDLMRDVLRLVRAQETIRRLFLAYLERTKGTFNAAEEKALLMADAERAAACDSLNLTTSRELMRRTTGWPPEGHDAPKS